MGSGQTESHSCRSLAGVVWNVTVIDTLAASYIAATAQAAGAASKIAENRKKLKYAAFEANYIVVPIALETLGSMAEASEAFLRDVAKRIRRTKGDRRGGFFLQRISLALQRGNAACILQGLPDGDDYRG